MSLPDAKAVDLRIVEITYREKGRGPALIFVHGLGGGQRLGAISSRHFPTATA